MNALNVNKDVVAFPYKPSYKRLSFLFILFFLMGTIVWATRFTHISDVFTVSAFNEFFRVGLVVWILYVMLLLVCFVKSNEAKNEAKEWNSIIVPEERLK
jgi:polyferredoxin